MDWQDIDWNEHVQQTGIVLTRIIIVAATLLGVYLLLAGETLLHRVFGLVMISVGGYLIYHHSIVISRQSLGG